MQMDPKIKTLLIQYHQEHLLAFKKFNNDEQNKQLLEDIANVNFAALCKPEHFSDNSEKQSIDDLLKPLDSSVHQSVKRTAPEVLAKYRNLGLEEISKGNVAALLLAGGQGTRLGSSLPKGMFDVGLPSGKTLYQIQAERIYRLQQLAKETFGQAGCIPWYIMTSEHTKEPTVEFFKKNNFFNLDPKNITVFDQNVIPCFSLDGKILLKEPHKIARSPDGNGGLYEAIRKQGILQDMKNRGIKHVQAYCVDNILVKNADPTFIGYCLTKNAECGAKVVEKVAPDEAVGIICQVAGKYKVVEYSEVSPETSQKRSADGSRLLFNAGNICNHYFTLDFLTNKVKEDELEYHVAKKKIPCIDSNGNLIKPETPNGIKLEKFIFDCFQFADPDKFAVWEVIREDEFSPLKNNDKAENSTPTTCRMSLFNLHQRYVMKAGGMFVDDQGMPAPLIPSPASIEFDPKNNQFDKQVICEISPLISYDGENLEPLCKGKTFKSPLCLN